MISFFFLLISYFKTAKIKLTTKITHQKHEEQQILHLALQAVEMPRL